MNESLDEYIVDPFVDLTNLRAMTFNIRHGNGITNKTNLELTANTIRDANVDFAALQEVDRYLPRSGFVDQITKLAKDLNMYWSFSKSVEIGITQYGNAILSKHPIVEEKKIYMTGFNERRSVLHNVVQVGTGSIPADKVKPVSHPGKHNERQVSPFLLNVINTHLGVTAAERKQQFPAVLGMLRNIKGPGVFLGDLNMKDKDPLLKELFPVWRKIHLAPPSPTLISGREIDHIYVNFSTKFARAWTIITGASDHFPVMAQFPLNMLHCY